ncbi:restriction endonuclease subunit S [Candidatus Kaiserbacteria bacterium]|nr:restriction endonuclease subunit S [Candidatus Kaiserbacteria bacterium]
MTKTLSKWNRDKLGNTIALVKNSWRPSDENIKYVGLEHINQDELSLNGVGASEGLASNKFRFSKGDILFGKLRPYFRKVVRPSFNGVCSTDIWVMRAKEGYDQSYLFYFMANPVLISKSMGASTGTHMPRADWNYLSGTEWYFPELSEQKEIAEVLSSLDDKIELLQKQSETLEQIAQALFKEWFLEFNFPDKNGKPYKKSGGKMSDSELGEIPEGWEVGFLNDISEITSGKRPDNSVDKKTKTHQIPLVGATRIMGYVEEPLYDEDILVIGRVGTHGVIQRFYDRVWVSDNAFVIKSKDFVFLYHVLKNINYEKLNKGAVQPLITQTDLKNYKLAMPNDNVMDLFGMAGSEVFLKLKENSFQVNVLSKIRDFLLPKLMNGEVRVK